MKQITKRTLEQLGILNDYDNDKIIYYDLDCDKYEWDYRSNLTAILDCKDDSSNYGIVICDTAYYINNRLK